MLQINVDRRSINRLEDLSNFIDTIPAKIKMANSRAAAMSARDIEQNLIRRGRPGEAIRVEYQPYGEFGLRFKLTPLGGGAGGRGRSKGGRYSLLIASRIFLNSEQGKTGRRAFTLPRRQADSHGTRRYQISHNSGEWRRGQRLSGPLRIPAIGPFYFSAKSGMPRKKISTFSREVIKDYINRYYENVLKRAGV